MASVLILISNSIGVQLANRLAYEGHIVKTWGDIQWKGHISNYLKLVEQYDLVLCNGPIYGHQAVELMNKKRTVLGGGLLNTYLTNIEYEQSVLKTIYPYFKITPEDAGIPITITGYRGKHGYIKPYQLSLIYERLTDGNRGPKGNWQQMGSVVMAINHCKLVEKTLIPIDGLLDRAGYLGPFGVKLYINKDDINFDRFITSFNDPSLFAWMELLRCSLFDFLYNMVNKVDYQVPRYVTQCSIAVTLIALKHVIDQELSNNMIKHVWKALDGHVDNVLYTATARGTDIRECRRRVYRTVDNLAKDPEIIYRSDIGRDAEGKYNQLKDWGWVE